MKKIIYRLTAFLMLAIILMNNMVCYAADTTGRVDAGAEYTYTMANGIRVLETYSHDDVYVRYTYDGQGRRTEKNINGKSTYYYYENERLIREVTGNFTTEYLYEDSSVRPYGFVYQGNTYYYELDAKRYITGIMSSERDLIVTYVFDENMIPKNIILGNTGDEGQYRELEYANSFLGIGYYFDRETGLYYNGRYYDAAAKKYIGAQYGDCTRSIYMGNDIQTCDVDYDAEADLWANELLNSSTYGKSIDYSENWYSDLSTVEILARLIYGENTGDSETQEREAITWLLLYRTDSPNEFGSGLRGVATEYEQFSTINPKRNSERNADEGRAEDDTAQARTPFVNLAWRNATYLACLIMLTNNKSTINDVIGKPAYYGNQVYFYSYKKVYGERKLKGSGDTLTMANWGGDVSVKDVAIIGVGIYTESSNIYAQDVYNKAYPTNDKSGKNVFYNFK